MLRNGRLRLDDDLLGLPAVGTVSRSKPLGLPFGEPGLHVDVTQAVIHHAVHRPGSGFTSSHRSRSLKFQRLGFC